MQHLTSYKPFVSQVIHAHSLLQSHNFVTGDHDCSKGQKTLCLFQISLLNMETNKYETVYK